MFEMTTGGMFAEPMDDHGNYTDVCATLLRTAPLGDLPLLKPDGNNVLSHFGSFRQGGAIERFGVVAPPAVVWKDVLGLSFWINPQGGSDQKISFTHIKVMGIDQAGAAEVLVDEPYEGGHLIVTDEGATIVLPARRPPGAAPEPQRPAQDVQDDVDGPALLAHLKAHSVYYSRAVALAQNDVERVNALAAITLPDGSTVADKVDPRPLELVGNRIAYSCTDSDWSSQVMHVLADQPDQDGAGEALDERLVALPTRGVFAEAKLGHCNASEVIQNTRFWDWQQSPIPHLAPEIAPITAVTPQAVQQNLTPAGFPASLVNIVNPPSAPDPTGTAAAMALLGTSNIFRDISGRAEVADILKNLADNAVKVAGGPAGGASRSSSTTGGGSTSSGAASTRGTAVGGPRAAPTQPSAVNRDLQDLQQVLGQAQSEGLITPQLASQAYGAALQSALAPGDLQNVGGRAPSDVYAQLPANITANQLIGLVGEQHLAEALRAEGLTVFMDWSKSVAANGFDMMAFDPKTKKLWLIDNKAQLRGVASAPSLTGTQFDGNLADARSSPRPTPMPPRPLRRWQRSTPSSTSRWSATRGRARARRSPRTCSRAAVSACTTSGCASCSASTRPGRTCSRSCRSCLAGSVCGGRRSSREASSCSPLSEPRSCCCRGTRTSRRSWATSWQRQRWARCSACCPAVASPASRWAWRATTPTSSPQSVVKS